MAGIYEDVPIGNMAYSEDSQLFTYLCPCGDYFQIGLEDLWEGENIADCPSCTLSVRVMYTMNDLPPLRSEVLEAQGEQTAVQV